LKLKKIRLFKTPQGICCVVATSLLRATPSTMEPQWSQFNYLAIQERQFCLGLSYQDVLPLVSTKKRTWHTSTRKSGTFKPTTPTHQHLDPNQKSTSGMTSISCRHHHRRRQRIKKQII